MRKGMHPEEVEERRLAFQRFWRRKALPKVAQVRPAYQGLIHMVVKMAYNAGADHERRKNEPTQLGGMD